MGAGCNYGFGGSEDVEDVDRASTEYVSDMWETERGGGVGEKKTGAVQKIQNLRKFKSDWSKGGEGYEVLADRKWSRLCERPEGSE